MFVSVKAQINFAFVVFFMCLCAGAGRQALCVPPIWNNHFVQTDRQTSICEHKNKTKCEAEAEVNYRSSNHHRRQYSMSMHADVFA